MLVVANLSFEEREGLSKLKFLTRFGF